MVDFNKLREKHGLPAFNKVVPKAAEIEEEEEQIETDSGDGLDFLSDFDAPQEKLDYSRDQIPIQFVTGSAGTGKTFQQQQLIRSNPSYGVLSATTGVAAINLGTITLNSLLRYFDTESLEDAYISGRLTAVLAQLAHESRHLVIDEASMLDGDQLDLIYQAVFEVSHYRSLRHPLGIVLTGDFLQLPPVNAKWAFEAKCWPAFDRHTTRLTTNYRQANPVFIQALGHARAGEGEPAAELLRGSGAQFTGRLDTNFQGTTIVARNTEVERYNRIALSRVQGRDISITATRWGKQRGEWIWKEGKQTGIPDQSTIRINSLVMILANNPPAFDYVNGDLGYVRDYIDDLGVFKIELLRNKTTVEVGKIERTLSQRQPPKGQFLIPLNTKEAIDLMQENKPRGLPYFDMETRRWILGSITYFPLRAGYAVTVHKAQGLTLDRVQVDCREYFFGSPNMAYVALSRVRTPEGLYIVSPPEVLARRIKVAPEVMRWI